MTSILFWNVQRLGAGTDAALVDGIVKIANQEVCDYEAYCELLQNCQVMTPNNYNYRKKTDQQLCYGARQYQLVMLPTQQMPIPIQYPLNRLDPEPESTDWYRAAKYKGGNNFSLLLNRTPAELGYFDGVHVYILHAPASNRAIKCISFLACHLQSFHGNNPWLLMGDLNVEPEQLALSPVSIPGGLASYILRTGVKTHSGGKELDYAITNAKDKLKMKIITARSNKFFTLSDHRPIIVSW